MKVPKVEYEGSKRWSHFPRRKTIIIFIFKSLYNEFFVINGVKQKLHSMISQRGTPSLFALEELGERSDLLVLLIASC